MASETHYSKGNELMADDLYDEALDEYNKAVEGESSAAELTKFLTKRAACHIKLRQFTNAVADANQAISLSPSDQMAHFRKGVACFSLDEFETALEAFKESEKLGGKLSATWIRKCEAELEELEEEEMDVEEPKKEEPKKEEEVKTEPKKEEPKAETKEYSVTSATAADLAPLPGFNRVKHDWYQTSTHVIITIYAKNVKEEDANIRISNSAVEVALQLEGGREFQLDLSLFDEVVASESSYRIVSVKVELKLKKAKPDVKWPGLEQTEGGTPVAWADTSAVDKSAYPTSSKKGPRNWDAIAKDDDEKLSGDAALNKVFQDIFSKGTDDQRRAMMKSFTESGGTVLSTNWDDVGKRTVEGTPPKGMEMHQWKELEKGK